MHKPFWKHSRWILKGTIGVDGVWDLGGEEGENNDMGESDLPVDQLDELDDDGAAIVGMIAGTILAKSASSCPRQRSLLDGGARQWLLLSTESIDLRFWVVHLQRVSVVLVDRIRHSHSHQVSFDPVTSSSREFPNISLPQFLLAFRGLSFNMTRDTMSDLDSSYSATCWLFGALTSLIPPYFACRRDWFLGISIGIIDSRLYLWLLTNAAQSPQGRSRCEKTRSIISLVPLGGRAWQIRQLLLSLFAQSQVSWYLSSKETSRMSLDGFCHGACNPSSHVVDTWPG